MSTSPQRVTRRRLPRCRKLSRSSNAASKLAKKTMAIRPALVKWSHSTAAIVCMRWLHSAQDRAAMHFAMISRTSRRACYIKCQFRPRTVSRRKCGCLGKGRKTVLKRCCWMRIVKLSAVRKNIDALILSRSMLFFPLTDMPRNFVKLVNLYVGFEYYYYIVIFLMFHPITGGVIDA